MADPKPKTVALTYTGVHDEVWVPDAEQLCARGASIDVDETLAASLLRQVDNWQPTRKPAAKKNEE